MTTQTTQGQLGYIAPFFIVRDVMPSIAFYRDRLGFEVMFLGLRRRSPVLTPC